MTITRNVQIDIENNQIVFASSLQWLIIDYLSSKVLLEQEAMLAITILNYIP